MSWFKRKKRNYDLYDGYQALATANFDLVEDASAYDWAYLDGFADAMALSLWRLSDGEIEEMFPLHHNKRLAALAESWYYSEHDKEKQS